MAKHFSHRRSYIPIAAGGMGVAVLAAGGVVIALHAQPSAADNRPGHGAGPASTTTTVAPKPALQISATTPASGAKGVDGSAALVITTSAPVDTAAGLPTISPSIDGTWTASGDQLQFAPNGAFAPSTTYTVTVPASLRSAATSPLGATRTWSFTTGVGSVMRLQQLLALLGYLPLSWTPTPGQTPTAPGGGPATPAEEIFHPPTGQFTWTWASPPPTLAATWVPGQYTVMTQGAVMAFEADHGLTTDGIAGAQVWSALVAATTSASPPLNQHGYSYALAQKTTPETLTVWHNGTVVSTSGTNTGIPQSPTQDGTYPVYERLATQIMRGTNPDGSKYADPVAWVAYFHGGDAIHYIARSYYGSPQSLGCLEVSYAVGKLVWPYMTLGSLVTVTG